MTKVSKLNRDFQECSCERFVKVTRMQKIRYGANTPDALCVVAKNRQELDVQKCNSGEKMHQFKVSDAVCAFVVGN